MICAVTTSLPQGKIKVDLCVSLGHLGYLICDSSWPCRRNPHFEILNYVSFHVFFQREYVMDISCIGNSILLDMQRLLLVRNNCDYTCPQNFFLKQKTKASMLFILYSSSLHMLIQYITFQLS